jgi:hypothetical protein
MRTVASASLTLTGAKIDGQSNKAPAGESKQLRRGGRNREKRGKQRSIKGGDEARPPAATAAYAASPPKLARFAEASSWRSTK